MTEIKYNPQAPQYDWELYTPSAGSFFAKFYSESDKTAGGLFRPDKYRRREIVGEVLSVGKPIKRSGEFIECPVGVGGFVMANPDYGTEIQRGEETDENGGTVEFVVKILGFSDIVAYKKEKVQ